MKRIEIYGASDDLIEIAPSGEHGTECNGGDSPRYLFFVDGTVLTVLYTEGVWRIKRVKVGTAEYEHIPGKSPDDDRYSDTVWLSGDSLCLPGTNTAAPVECWRTEAGATAREIVQRLDGFCDFGSIAPEALIAFYRAARAASACE